MKLPPHNQRRLNVRIAETYGDRYADWYDLACDLQIKGATYEHIRAHFASLGIKVSQYTVYGWVQARRRADARAEQAA